MPWAGGEAAPSGRPDEVTPSGNPNGGIALLAFIDLRAFHTPSQLARDLRCLVNRHDDHFGRRIFNDDSEQHPVPQQRIHVATHENTPPRWIGLLILLKRDASGQAVPDTAPTPLATWAPG